jgi:hypothetical protein
MSQYFFDAVYKHMSLSIHKVVNLALTLKPACRFVACSFKAQGGTGRGRFSGFELLNAILV